MYKPKQHGVIRDVCYPSVIAACRPALATRLTWEDNEEASGENINRGTSGDNRVAKFNEQLRSGLGTGRPVDGSE
jgi:hypothetical protein